MILRNLRDRQGGRYHQQVAVYCQPNNESADVVTSHRLGRRIPGADAQTRPRPVIVTFATPLVKRPRTDGVRQRRHNASAGGVGQEHETTEEVKKHE